MTLSSRKRMARKYVKSCMPWRMSVRDKHSRYDKLFESVAYIHDRLETAKYKTGRYSWCIKGFSNTLALCV
jgi:hypothetical protein